MSEREIQHEEKSLICETEGDLQPGIMSIYRIVKGRKASWGMKCGEGKVREKETGGYIQGDFYLLRGEEVILNVIRGQLGNNAIGGFMKKKSSVIQ